MSTADGHVRIEHSIWSDQIRSVTTQLEEVRPAFESASTFRLSIRGKSNGLLCTREEARRNLDGG